MSCHPPTCQSGLFRMKMFPYARSERLHGLFQVVGTKDQCDYLAGGVFVLKVDDGG